MNYVVAASSTNNGDTYWLVGTAEGLDSDAQLTTLWTGPLSPSGSAAPAQEITLRTNGRSCLEVWFGRQCVYAADDLSLDIEPPFQPYLEVQALEIAYAARFTDYWVSEDDTIAVRGLQPGEPVSFTQSDGTVCTALGSAVGVAQLTLQMPTVHGRGSLRLGRDVGASLGPFPYAGGDKYLIAP